MSRQQRLALILAAAAVAVIVFIVLRPSDDSSDKTSSTTQSAQTTPADTSGGASTSTTPAPTAQPKPAAEKITISGGKPAGGVKNIAVTKGDKVAIIVTSADTSDEVHVHGYDVHGDLAPGKPVKIAFTAKIEGVFEIELEGAKTQIAKLKVQP